MAEAVAVGVRVRPFNEREKALKADLCIEMEGPRTTLTYKGKENVFTFDESFWSHDGFEEVDGLMVPRPGSKYADQQVVFDAFGQRVLNNAWDGFHCCLFAYGQTGAGKSYSMVGYGKNKGIVPISCEEIFRRIEANDNPSRRYEITASMIEIYNETVQDLLILPQDRPQGGLAIHESKMLGVYVDGVRKTPVVSYAAIEKVINTATEHRTVGNTLMNATSSRAHTVLTIEFKQVEVIEGKEGVKLSMINLVDLAGSEKSTQTGAAGDRLKEGCMINKSLSALGNVIEKLAKRSSGKKKAQDVVVPYRDSKLTRLLQNALGGSSKTIMICALSPASSNAEETLSTLRYADRAKQIKNCATVNEDPQGRLLREMKEENEKLKEAMASLGGGGSVDVEAMQTRIAELARAEEALHEMQRSFAEKLVEAKEVERAMKEKERKKGCTTVLQRRLPHIVNLNEEVQLSGKLVYFFEEDKETLIGNPNAEDDSDSDSASSSSSSGSSLGGSSGSNRMSSEASEGLAPPDVALRAEDIYLRHATVTNANGKCYLNSPERAATSTFVNGISIDVLLSQRRAQEGEASKSAADVPAGVVLEHADRVAFGAGAHMIFLFIEPEKGAAEHVLLGQGITYAMAREELRSGFAKRFRTLGIVFAGPEASSGDVRSAGGDGDCSRCRKELEARDRQIQELRSELADVHAELAALRRERKEAPAFPCGLEASSALAGLSRSKADPVSAMVRDTFEEAIGALDLLQMRLTSTKTRSGAGAGGTDVRAIYSF
uniref:Kinesin-like protein n=1 Tax=Alexandrium monilatum TaxID=311494 RepID=A0A7S4RM80_9DINO